VARGWQHGERRRDRTLPFHLVYVARYLRDQRPPCTAVIFARTGTRVYQAACFGDRPRGGIFPGNPSGNTGVHGEARCLRRPHAGYRLRMLSCCCALRRKHPTPRRTHLAERLFWFQATPGPILTPRIICADRGPGAAGSTWVTRPRSVSPELLRPDERTLASAAWERQARSRQTLPVPSRVLERRPTGHGRLCCSATLGGGTGVAFSRGRAHPGSSGRPGRAGRALDVERLVGRCPAPDAGVGFFVRYEPAGR